jgi:dTDP-4-amino-4,6-dideoxygalactose transaminase
MLGARRLLGDEPVALPAYGCYDLVTAVVGSASRVRFYDLDPSTLGPNVESLQKAVGAGVSAVVVAHYYGIPADIESLKEVLKGTLVIEDAAQGAGARLHDRPLGAFGSMGILSFGRGKGVTCGRGGALLANDEVGKAILDLFRDGRNPHPGWSDVAVASAVAWLSRPSIFWIPALLPFLRLGEAVYKPPVPSRPASRAAAAFLARSWGLAESEARLRRRNAKRLQNAIQSSAAFSAVAVAPPACPGYLRLPVLARDRAARARSVNAGCHLGVAEGYPHPLPNLEPVAARRVDASDNFCGAQNLSECLLTLPVHGLLDDRDLARLEQWIVTGGRPDG